MAIDAESRTIRADLCISTYTIEMKQEGLINYPHHYREGREEIFGCDICQDVCPWNKKYLSSGADQENTPRNFPSEITQLLNFEENDSLIKIFTNMSEEEFKKKFAGTNFERTTKNGLLKNLTKMR